MALHLRHGVAQRRDERLFLALVLFLSLRDEAWDINFNLEVVDLIGFVPLIGTSAPALVLVL